MNFGEIKKCDIANGEGVRVSLFVSGCTHHCKGCFNPQTWDFHFGEPFTEDVESSLLEDLAPSYIKGLTLLGGEPMEPENQRVLMPFLRKVKERFPSKTIWCYSGYTLDKDMIEGGKAWCEVTDEMLSMMDVLVDGEFVEALKDIRLVFKGSSNQRIINLQETLKKGEIVLYME
ncbi:MAG: anaerobic ribonucleoside-triphosphate reductase activating protein [Lachnospiraceae bacterium]|nr:anaerobic ribonucleoside-triphosphate reductase activating protein [Lachnospiraceae bacterium]